MAQLAAYLDGDDGLEDGGLKPWTLAGELAGVFGKYQASRRDWLLRWEGGADPDDPQAILWRAVAPGRDHRARRIQDYLARFGGDADAVPVGVPSRLFALTPLHVPAHMPRGTARPAPAGPLHLGARRGEDK